MIVKNGKVVSRLLYCQVCEVWTNHVAITGGFICSCGEVTVIPSAKGGVNSLLAMTNEAKTDLQSTSHDVEISRKVV